MQLYLDLTESATRAAIADQLREKREQFEMERDPEVAQILKDISL